MVESDKKEKGGKIMTTKSSKITSSTTLAQINPKSKEATLFQLGTEAVKIIDAFKVYLVTNSKAKATINSYIFDVKSFVDFIEKVEKQVFKGQFNEKQYKNYIKSQRKANYRIATLNKRINSIASFNNYLTETNLMSSRIADLKTDKIVIEKPEIVSTDNSTTFPQELVKII